jgi:hypothetical protein
VCWKYDVAACAGDPALIKAAEGEETKGKISMKQLFGKKNIKKDGTEGKVASWRCCRAAPPVIKCIPRRAPA